MTHDKIKALDKLIAAVEGGIEWLDWLDHEEALPYEMLILARDANHDLLDAAKALHDALLGYDWSIASFSLNGEVSVKRNRPLDVQYGFADMDPARAWLIAILKAYRSQMEAS